MSYTMITERGARPIKAWVGGVHFDDNARQQLINTAKLPFVFKWVASLPAVYCKSAPQLHNTKHCVSET
jgi:tRNA-splicing ligase RtcB